jgi:hypothetical protein
MKNRDIAIMSARVSDGSLASCAATGTRSAGGLANGTRPGHRQNEPRTSKPPPSGASAGKRPICRGFERRGGADACGWVGSSTIGGRRRCARMASLTRSMSTLLNGMQVDEGGYRRDVDRLVKGAQAAAKASTKAKTTAQR